jgi:hypothetical protein
MRAPALLAASCSSHATQAGGPIAEPNDNRTPAGTLSDSGLTVTVGAWRVKWHPDGGELLLPLHDTGGASVAKDGADPPESARAPQLARQVVSMGETCDFEYIPRLPGIRRIVVRPAGASGSLLARVPLRLQ